MKKMVLFLVLAIALVGGTVVGTYVGDPEAAGDIITWGPSSFDIKIK